MRAILVKQPGNSNQLFLGEFPKPSITSEELLVRVKATAVNRADILQRKGLYPPPEGASPLLGLEVSGMVEAVGSGVDDFSPGDDVFAIVPGGGYAEYAAVHAGHAMKIPQNLSDESAAGIAEVFLTAFQALFWHGEIENARNVLIHAGASGVGTAAIQLAAAEGCRVMVTAGSPEKVEFCQSIGAASGVNYRKEAFSDHVLGVTENRGADIIIDFVGGSYLRDNLSCIAQDGRLVILALMGGKTAENIDLSVVLRKRVKIIGSTLRNRSNRYKSQLVAQFTAQCMERFTQGTLKPVIDRVFSWEDVRQAHDYMEANANMGKIILTIT